MDDYCSLCTCPMSIHTVRTEEVIVNGVRGVRPVGWDCPIANPDNRKHESTKT